MQKDYSFLMYRQDLPGFGEPAEGSWDGWSRINTDTGAGGIVGVFRENAVEAERVVSLPYLKPESGYEVRNAPGGQIIHIMTGKELKDKGFKVSIDAGTGSQFFEIRKVAQ
jgi:alpha-galactosidase